MTEFVVATGDQAFYRTEDIQLGGYPSPVHTQECRGEAPRRGLGRHAQGAHLPFPYPRLQKQHSEGESRAGSLPPAGQAHRFGQR